MLRNKYYKKSFILDQADNICNIYFDHKLASGVSTFQGIISFGLYYMKNEATDVQSNLNYLLKNMKPIPLIRGCEDVYTADKIKLLYDDHFDLQVSLKNICPPAFYKTIKYSVSKLEDINKLKDLPIFPSSLFSKTFS